MLTALQWDVLAQSLSLIFFFVQQGVSNRLSDVTWMLSVLAQGQMPGELKDKSACIVSTAFDVQPTATL